MFAPVWAIDNASVLWGNLRLLNLPDGTLRRQQLLWMQAASWVLFRSFNYVYFRRRSPILAFVGTASFHALTIASAVLGWKVDRKMSLSFVTQLLWLALALPAYQAIHNRDQFSSARRPGVSLVRVRKGESGTGGRRA